MKQVESVRLHDDLFNTTEVVIGYDLSQAHNRFYAARLIRVADMPDFSISMPSLSHPSTLQGLRDYAALVSRVLHEAEMFQDEINQGGA
jgi:hypothetical protein